MKDGNDRISRRRFMETACGMAMLGGGLMSSIRAGATRGSTSGDAAVHEWDSRWRPASPKRLSDVTHELARRALSGEHGRAMANADFGIDENQLVGMSPDMRYARAVMAVARNAPLRILPGERIVGSATLLEAPAHRTPVAGVTSTSHTTIGFDKVLSGGYAELRRRIAQRRRRGGFDDPAPMATSEGRHGQAFVTSGGAGHWAEARSLDEYSHPPLTVECWAKVYSKTPFNVLVLNQHKNSRLHWEIYSYAGSGYFSAYLPGYSPSEIKSDRDITDGRWHYLAMQFEAGRVRLYVDGDLVADEKVEPTDALQETGGALYFGTYPAHSIGCDGGIEEVRISTGVRAIDGVPHSPLQLDDNTVGLWRIGEAEGRLLLADASSDQNHAFPSTPVRGEDFLDAMETCLDAADIWHSRYMAELQRRIADSTGEERRNYVQVRDALRNVPNQPPNTFHEAVQALWFAYAFQRLLGNWSGIGRIDEMLGPFLKADLGEGRITLDEAREILAHFWIKGCEWIGAFDTRGSGDAQHYQNIVLAGVDADGNEVTNEVTYLVLDVVEELHISDFPIAVRLNSNTPQRLLRRIAQVQRHGGGIVAVYNEETVIDGLVKFGYPLREARTFANDGCWEVIIPGKTTFAYSPFDMLAILQRVLGLHSDDTPEFDRFDDLYAAFMEGVGKHIGAHHRAADNWGKNGYPTPLLSLLVDDCIERARGYHDRGSHYYVLSPHAGGMANVADGLLVIRKLVYERERLTLPEFVDILRSDWEGREPLRRFVRNRFTFYGNDDEQADEMIQRVFNDYTDLVWRVRERSGVKRPAGISTFGREIEWRHGAGGRKASADGHRQGAILATNFSPSPGSDQAGPTAVIKSYCKCDLTRVPNGATIELKVHPESVRGDRGVDALVALMRSFVQLGGMFMHVDIVNSAMLVDAQKHPEKYPNLSVRVAGWSARFATLNEEWQNMVIQRTQQFV